MYTFNLTTEQVSILDKALGEMPYRVAAPLIQDLQAQIDQQMKDEPVSQD